MSNIAARALKRIEEVLVNSNSEPDRMGECLDKIERIIEDSAGYENVARPADTLLIQMDGGLIHAVESDAPGQFSSVDVLVIDADTEGADEDMLYDVEVENGRDFSAYVKGHSIDPTGVNLKALKQELYARGMMEPCASPAPIIHVLVIEHGTGSDVSAHTSRAGAEAACLEFVKENWDHEMPSGTLIEEAADPIDDYFAEVEGESFEIYICPVESLIDNMPSVSEPETAASPSP